MSANVLALADTLEALNSTFPATWQIALTSASVHSETADAGALLGGPVSTPSALQSPLLCDVLGANEDEIPHDPDYICGEYTVEVTQEYLLCVCGEFPSNVGDEQPIEASYLALCRALAAPPEECFAEGSPLSTEDQGTNDSLLRGGSRLAVVFIGDQGDSSWRLPEQDSDITVYESLFTGAVGAVTFSAFAPDLKGDQIECNTGGASPWRVQRLQALVERSGGIYTPRLKRSGEECILSDMAQFLADVAENLSE